MAVLELDHDMFLAEWNGLDGPTRRRVRRLVRMGRPVDPPALAPVAVDYALFQRRRLWMRYFWAWFPVGLIVAVGIATQIHPLVVGVVLALSAQAVLARRGLARAERVNADALGSV